MYSYSVAHNPTGVNKLILDIANLFIISYILYNLFISL